MARRPYGHNLSCGVMLSIEIGSILLAVILASDTKAKGSSTERIVSYASHGIWDGYTRQTGATIER